MSGVDITVVTVFFVMGGCDVVTDVTVATVVMVFLREYLRL